MNKESSHQRDPPSPNSPYPQKPFQTIPMLILSQGRATSFLQSPTPAGWELPEDTTTLYPYLHLQCWARGLTHRLRSLGACYMGEWALALGCSSGICTFFLTSIFYWCLTNYHHANGLEQHTVMISQFLSVNSLGTDYLGPCLRVSQGYNQGVGRAAVSSEAQVGRNLLPRSFRKCGFISLWLLDWGPQLHAGSQLETAHSFLPHGPLHGQATSPTGQITFSKPARSLSLQSAMMELYIS